jgi:hypothetical protein
MAKKVGRPKGPRRSVMIVRLPDAKAFLPREAARFGGSQNSEVIRSVKMRMEAEQAQRRAG